MMPREYRQEAAVRRTQRLWRVLLGLLILATAAVPPARAESASLALKNIKVSVWPEYDEPKVLVTYEGEFGGATFPQEVQFRLPAGAEAAQVCALKKPADEHICQLYQIKPEGDGLLLTYTLPIPTFFVEFYYYPLQGAGPRDIDFSFRPLYPVESLELEVQEPLRAAEFRLAPPSSTVSSDGQGFRYYHYQYSNLPSEQPVQVKIAYSKADANPSVAKRQPGGAAPGGLGYGLGLPLALGGAVVLAVLAAWVLGHRARGRVSVPQAAPAWRGAGTGPEKKAGVFCTQCGQALRREDNFCPRCGRKARRPS